MYSSSDEDEPAVCTDEMHHEEMHHEETEEMQDELDFPERIRTFVNYPSPCPVNPVQLATAGFRYLDSEHIVQCTSCKKIVCFWSSGDEPGNCRFHESGCKFVNRNSLPTNTGIRSYSSYQPHHGHSAAILSPQDHQGAQGSSSSASLPAMRIYPRYNQPLSPSIAEPSSFRNMASSLVMFKEESTRFPSFHSRTSLSSFQPSTSNASSSPLDTLEMRNAADRLKTFEDLWPRGHLFQNIRLLVSCGFFCIGEDDAVECFSCHVLISNWNRNDDPKQRHLQAFATCRFVRGEDCGDIPLVRETRQQPLALLYHQCYPSLRSVDESQHGSLAPSLTSLSNQPISQPTPESHAETRPSEVFSSQQTSENLFSCNNPANPAMRSEVDRKNSFIRNRLFRRNTNLLASNEDLARAGLYSIGVGDKVRCWYCDGMLEGFEPNDDPIVEHAKYFPECEFVLQQMGVEWVTAISMQFPDIERPILPTRVSVVLPQVVSSPTPLPPPPGEIQDPEARRRMRQEMLEEGMRTEIVNQVIQIGFNAQDVENAMRRKIQRSGCYYQSASSLVHVLIEQDESSEEDEQGDEEMVEEHSLHPVENDLQRGDYIQYLNNGFRNEGMIVADALSHMLTPPPSPT